MIELFLDNKPVLEPYKTGIVIDAILLDTEHIIDSDADEVYSFTFGPYSADDDYRLTEHIAMCKSNVELLSGPHSNKDIRFVGEAAAGFIRCTQMYPPKVSLKVEHWSELQYKPVTLNLCVNDDARGRVYLNCAYCDPYVDPCEDDGDTSLDTEEIDNLF
jgi:hypothetical protein